MRRSIVGAALLTLVGTGCSLSGLQFFEDDRISFVKPGYREMVKLPVAVEWSVKPDFKITGPTPQARKDAGYFAVLIDVDALPVGKTLRHYARDDRACRPDAGCPDAKYLADRGILTTTETKLTIERLDRLPSVDVEKGDRDLHEVTIVLLDGLGRRIGGSVWTQTFELERSSAN